MERSLFENGRGRPSSKMKRRLKDFEERSDLSMNGLTKGLILICWQSQPNCWRRRDQLGAFVHSIGSSVYIYCTLTRSAASLFPFEKRRAWVMLDANWASAPFPSRSMLHNCRNTWFFSTLAIVEARREIVAVPMKLQNNTNPYINIAHREMKRNQRERERENAKETT